MIDSAYLNSYTAAQAPQQGGEKARLLMRRDPESRMAGTMPVWQSRNAAPSAQAVPSAPSNPVNAQDFKTALHYADQPPQEGGDVNVRVAEDPADEFTFGDLVDIVNPLHHIPLVNVVYESITGDTIKPAGRIVGGAVFGGFVGAAAGIANVIVEEETGKDVSGNIVALMRDGQMPRTRHEKMSPEQQLDQAARLAFNPEGAQGPLPTLAYALQSPQIAPEQSAGQSPDTPAHTTSIQAYSPDK
ncbi:MAG TPA: hypothetical protein VGD95_00405, partial [Micavibrio sp.]